MNVSLEELVPQDHVERQVERSLDLTFVRELVRTAYVGSGRSSVARMVFSNSHVRADSSRTLTHGPVLDRVSEKRSFLRDEEGGFTFLRGNAIIPHTH